MHPDVARRRHPLALHPPHTWPALFQHGFHHQGHDGGPQAARSSRAQHHTGARTDTTDKIVRQAAGVLDELIPVMVEQIPCSGPFQVDHGHGRSPARAVVASAYELTLRFEGPRGKQIPKLTRNRPLHE